MGDSGSPGPKLVAGIPRSAKNATSVQPSFALGWPPAAATSRASSGSPNPGGADGARSSTSMRSPRARSRAGASNASTAARASSAERSGAKRWLSVTVAESGTTLPATPPRTPTACSASRYAQPSITGLAARVAGNELQHRAQPVDGVDAQSRGGPCGPARRRRSRRVATHPDIPPPRAALVGSVRMAASPTSRSGRSANSRERPLCFLATSSHA